MFIIFVPSPANAATIHVPADASTIQAAVDAAAAGDTVIVDGGTYRENVIVNKAINLTGNDNGGGLPVVDGMGGNAIWVRADGVTVKGFNATNASAGISVSSNYNTITGNVAGHNRFGIDVEGASYNNITGNVANGNQFEGIALFGTGSLSNCQYNNVADNTANGNLYANIYLYNASYNRVEDNLANGSMDNGIKLLNSYDNVVVGNTAGDNYQVGIYLDASSENSIADNAASSNYRGIMLAGSDENDLFGNTASHNMGDGIYLVSSSGCTVTGNIVSDNINGIYVEGWNDGNYLAANAVSGNGNYGIYLGDSSGSSVTRNNISDNGNGIYLHNSWDNVLWLNTIRGNIFNATVNGEGWNRWNSTAQIQYSYAGYTYDNYLGNYWGDYNGPDENSDGIGDVSYPVLHDRPDYYPILFDPSSPPVLQFSQGTYWVSENEEYVTLVVDKAGYADEEVLVDYTITDGSAHASINYVTPSPYPGTLSIPASASYGEITIPILDDGIPTEDLSFNVRLTTAHGSPAGTTIGSPCEATVTIHDESIPFTFDLKEGWNLVSYPFARGKSINVEGLFYPLAGHVVIVWAYDPEQGWLYYIPGGDDNTLATIDDTMGVWVLMSSDESFTIWGTPPWYPPEAYLSPGWNLIGYPSFYSGDPYYAFYSIDDLYSVAWGYDSGSGEWLWYVPGGEDNNLDWIEPGRAYWVQMNEPGYFSPGYAA